MVTALMVAPGEHPCPTMLCDDPEFLLLSVSRGLLTTGTTAASKLAEGVIAIFNLDAAVYGAVGNRRIGERIIAGVFYVVGYSGAGLVSLTDEQMTRYMKKFWAPENHDLDDVLDSCLKVMEQSMDINVKSVF